MSILSGYPQWGDVPSPSPPGTPFPTFVDDALLGTFSGRLVSADRIRLQERTMLVVELERLGADGTVMEWGDVAASVSLVRLGQVPLLHPENQQYPEWAGLDVQFLQEYPGSRLIYRASYPVIPTSVPGARTLESGREYGVWILFVLGENASYQMIGSVLIDG